MSMLALEWTVRPSISNGGQGMSRPYPFGLSGPFPVRTYRSQTKPLEPLVATFYVSRFDQGQ